jgi:hypothetical protein
VNEVDAERDRARRGRRRRSTSSREEEEEMVDAERERRPRLFYSKTVNGSRRRVIQSTRSRRKRKMTKSFQE